MTDEELDLSEPESPPGADDLDYFSNQPNALREAQDWLRYTHRQLLKLLIKMVPWSDFWEYEYKGKSQQLSYTKFEVLMDLAMGELFTDHDDDKLAKIFGVPEKWIPENREHPQYEPIKAAMRAAMERTKAKKGIDGWAELIEDAAAQEVAATALFAKSGREKQGAQDALLDRRSAKKGRGAETGAVHIYLPDGFERTRDRALQIEAQIRQGRQAFLPPAPEEDVIDASFVRVPDDED